MAQEATSLHFHVDYKHPTLCTATVKIPPRLVDAIYQETLQGQKQYTSAQGFRQGNVPVGYIEHNFRASLLEHLKEFLFKHMVLSYLYKEIRLQKLTLAGEPRLTDIFLEPHRTAEFSFECSLFPSVILQNWKFFPFKAPKRKNYKDLDRQVDTFIKDERDAADKHDAKTIHTNDWVCFDMTLVDAKNKPIFGTYKERLWLKIGDEEADQEFRDLFLGKQVGDLIRSNNICLQEYFSDFLNTNYCLCLEIKDILSHNFFCFELFKKHFRLKTNKEMLQKLIEVFSYRNDMTQRRAIIEETFKILLAKHQFDAPNHLVLRQQKLVMDAVQENPDYNVYRSQHDFKERVRDLAEKQIKEVMIIDQIAYQEDIIATDDDIKCYLNFIKRQRMKDFLYFQLPETKVGGQELPLSSEFLKQYCLREKTLNYIIYHLTKK